MFPELIEFSDYGLLVLRLAVATIFIYHALPKLQNPKGMAQGVGMPAGMVLMLGFVELLSSIGLIIGFYTQIAAILLAVVMVGATYFKMLKWHMPFTAMDKTGWEFDLILLAANIAILLTGGGIIGIQ
ncbi:MAG: DoxX family protein [Candidatus Colwellbacteria bacterium]|nr:DoxX family protein [Candidatus Colwellbacteria bacterium]